MRCTVEIVVLLVNFENVGYVLFREISQYTGICTGPAGPLCGDPQTASEGEAGDGDRATHLVCGSRDAGRVCRDGGGGKMTSKDDDDKIAKLHEEHPEKFDHHPLCPKRQNKSGPAQVSTAAYRDNYETIFGTIPVGKA
jgi:hypothetical protein